MPGDTGRRTQTICPAQWLAERCQATYRDASPVPEQQRGADACTHAAGDQDGRQSPRRSDAPGRQQRRDGLLLQSLQQGKVITRDPLLGNGLSG
jgi:hypothetical protein